MKQRIVWILNLIVNQKSQRSNHNTSSIQILLPWVHIYPIFCDSIIILIYTRFNENNKTPFKI